MRIASLVLVLLATLAACGQGQPAPSAQAPAAAELTAPKGEYKSDPYHSSLTFRLGHMGLSNYTARFTKFDVLLQLDPANLAGSSVNVSIDPTSIRTDFSGDYKGTHKDSPYASFDEALGQGPKFLNAGAFPAITFKSTKVEPAGGGRLRVTGDLTLLGQTHPVTLDVALVGSVPSHPYTKVGALGYSARGSFKRSEFGMMVGLQPQQFLGDDVSIEFEGEFAQQVAAPST